MTHLRKLMQEVEQQLVANDTIYHDPYTMVKVLVKVYPGAKPWAGIGFSKRNPTDKPNKERGVSIARGRAIKNLAQSILDTGMENSFKNVNSV